VTVQQPAGPGGAGFDGRADTRVGDRAEDGNLDVGNLGHRPTDERDQPAGGAHCVEVLFPGERPCSATDLVAISFDADYARRGVGAVA
jgi:hypothetical protein